MSSSDKQKMHEMLVRQSEEMKASIEQRVAQIKFIEQQMGDITNFVRHMVGQFN
jgi:hypothetical protein